MQLNRPSVLLVDVSADQAGDPTPAEGSMTHLTVLIVEDEPLVLMDIAADLRSRGFDVIEASNADDAIAILLAHAEVHLLFTDVDMPGSMDGLKLAAAVRDRWPPIKIIVASGHRRVALEEMPSGSRFFSKPYQADAVALAMREMVA